MKKIYIILTRTNTILSRLINFIKKDEYTHASISLDSNLNSMYSFGRKNYYNPFIGRFVKESLDEGVFGLQKDLVGLVLTINVTSEQYEGVEKLLNEFIKNSDSYKYNYTGLINNLLNKEKCYSHRFLCSEFVYFLLKENNISNLNKSRNLVRPIDLLELESEIVFKGNLKNTKWSSSSMNKIEIIPNYQSI